MSSSGAEDVSKRLSGSLNCGKSICWPYHTCSSCLGVNILNLRISAGISLTPIDAAAAFVRFETEELISLMSQFSLLAAALFLKAV